MTAGAFFNRTWVDISSIQRFYDGYLERSLTENYCFLFEQVCSLFIFRTVILSFVSWDIVSFIV